MAKPVYMFSGFLDGGKTTAIKDSLLDPDFNEGETTALLVFEQGDEEYDDEFLFDTNSQVIYYDSFDKLTKEEMLKVEKFYNPDRIIIELNGMDDETRLYEEDAFIPNWELAQALTFFDGTSLKMQITNMKQFVYNHVFNTELVVVNRVKEDDILYFRNTIKAINPRAQVVFMDADNNVYTNISSQLFDTTKPINVTDEDFGLWYIDALDDAEKYDGCTITMKLKPIEVIREYRNVIIMGRKAMVCCSNDIQDIGITVVNIDPRKTKYSQFYTITGKIKTMVDEEGYNTCVLYADHYEPSEKPVDELVNFN